MMDVAPWCYKWTALDGFLNLGGMVCRLYFYGVDEIQTGYFCK